jgi:4-hydroxybenzoate polyprenyltransferase
LPEILKAFFLDKEAFKSQVAQLMPAEVSLLPYRDEVISLIRAARARGQPVILCSGSPPEFVQAVADHLGLFDTVFVSPIGTGFGFKSKAAAFVQRFGSGGFDYVGNSHDDLLVFERCRYGILVSSRHGLRHQSLGRNSSMTFVDDPSPSLKIWLRAIRTHQWVKNILIFVPLAAAHAIGEVDKVVSAILAFIAFSLCASATYIGNDLLDIDSDRAHRTKKHRPLAAGGVSISSGIGVLFLLLFSSFLLAGLLPFRFGLVLVTYLFTTAIYSLLLKRQVVVDVILLCGLYTLRIIAGAAATRISPSFWLLSFSMFIFLSLAMVKRVSELQRAAGDGELSGRGYVPNDKQILIPLGTASGLISVLVLALYIQSDAVSSMYPSKGWLWLIPAPMLYWMTRLWLKTNRNEIDDDQVVFATKDWQSLVLLASIGALFLLAIWGPALW